MNKADITKAIDMFVTGQGNQAGLQGLADILHALNNETETVVMADIPYIVNISALQTVEMTAEQATAAGFTMEMIMELTRIAHPTIKFSDMVVTFNAFEKISNDLSIWTGIVYDAPTDTVYHCALYLYYDGRILYNVDVMQH